MNTKIEATEIELNGIKYVPKDSVAQAPKLDPNNAVIVRTRSAGVFFGYQHTSSLSEGLIVLKNARRIWYWAGAASLSQLAVDGTSKPKECKFPVSMPEVCLTEVLEIIKCTETSVASINSVSVWKQ